MKEAHNTRDREDRDKTFAVLNILLRLGPGPHKFREIVAQSKMTKSCIQRRLRMLVDADLCHRTSYGYYELQPADTVPVDAPGLVVPLGSTPLFNVGELLDQLHQRTNLVSLLHTYHPLRAERLCVAAAGTSDIRFRRHALLFPKAIERLRQAPLDSDAPGLAILANLARRDAPLREDLRQIRHNQVARTKSPITGWNLVSAPIRRLPGIPTTPGAEPQVVGAVSLLTPELPNGSDLVAYGRLLRNAIREAVETSTLASCIPTSATAEAS
ncbi:hypothetical protein [Streptomyces sp. NPDC001948]